VIIHDISLTVVPGMAVWPGDPGLSLERVNKIENGANANVSHLDMGVHTGTHIDAPFHFLPQGASVEKLDLNVLIGQAHVVDISGREEEIGKDSLVKAGVKPGIKRLLLKTVNSEYWLKPQQRFESGFLGVNLEGAEYVVELGIQLVGIDYLSIAPFHKSRPTHLTLLSAGIVILEGLNLNSVSAGVYYLVALPIKLGGSDGAPARVVLIDN